MRIDGTALIRGLAAAAVREQERRRAAAQSEAEAAWQQLLSQIEEMARRFVALPRAGDRELAEQLAEAKDWGRIDELRVAVDLSRAEAVALAMTVNADSARRLLRELI